MLIKNLYENDLDKAWYESSNILYSECIDKEGELKTVSVTFKDGRTYKYFKVNVNDYLIFRNSKSQGKTFGEYIRKYECERVDSKDVSLIKEELDKLIEKDKEEDRDGNEEQHAGA